MSEKAQVSNAKVRDILMQYIDSIKQTGIIPVPFLLFAGPSGLGKMAIAEECLDILIGDYKKQDSLMLYDCSVDLEKPHTIKVSNDEEISRADGSLYHDLGIREVHQWIVTSPVGKYKILVIEDIERLTESAANALLKVFEEPLPGRLIIGTTSQVGSILPTIISRAFTFSFYPVQDEYILQKIKAEPALQSYDPLWLCALATGRAGVLDELLTTPDMLRVLQDAYTAVSTMQSSYAMLYKNLLPLAKQGCELLFFQAYIYILSQQGKRDELKRVYESYQLCTYAINNEHILFDFAIDHNAPTQS